MGTCLPACRLTSEACMHKAPSLDLDLDLDLDKLPSFDTVHMYMPVIVVCSKAFTAASSGMRVR